MVCHIGLSVVTVLTIAYTALENLPFCIQVCLINNLRMFLVAPLLGLIQSDPIKDAVRAEYSELRSRDLPT